MDYNKKLNEFLIEIKNGFVFDHISLHLEIHFIRFCFVEKYPDHMI